ncbi:MAG: AAA-like domain-containing protein [Microcystaceae cyanobacterium]
MSYDELTWQKVKKTAQQLIKSHFSANLKDIELQVLEGSWQGLTYEQMAEQYHLSINYVRGDIGSQLWKKLSEALGESVTKKNFKAALERASQTSLKPNQNDNITSTVDIPFPSGSTSPDSPFYIRRDNIESLCYETLDKTGALIRIKAPKLMGKTSLINSLLNYSSNNDYQTIYLDLQAVESRILENLDKLLRWLCLQLIRQLKLENHLKDYWDTDILGSNDNCTGYFEDYILPSIETPLIIALDTVDRLFEYQKVIEDFFGLLRSWHEKSKTDPLWQKLRLILSHSTEVYIPLNINRSPFNAGLPIELSEFTPHQVQTLAQLHQLNLSEDEQEKLQQIIGGHPYLIRLVFYHLSKNNLSFNDLLENYASDNGIFSAHLRSYLEVLQNNSVTIEALKQVVKATNSVELDTIQTYKLHSLGLVEYDNNRVRPRFELYKTYFGRILAT